MAQLSSLSVLLSDVPPILEREPEVSVWSESKRTGQRTGMQRGFVTGHDVILPLFPYLSRGSGRVIQIECVVVNGGRLSGYIVSVQGKAFGYSQGCTYRK